MIDKDTQLISEAYEDMRRANEDALRYDRSRNPIAKEVLKQINPNQKNIPKLLYHGTSLKQFEKIKSNDYNVNNFYVGDNQANITDYYAEKQSNIDNSPQVTIVLDRRKMKNLQKDYHSVIEGEEEQIGQFYFSGNIVDAIIRIEMYDEDTDKVILLDK